MKSMRYPQKSSNSYLKHSIQKQKEPQKQTLKLQRSSLMFPFYRLGCLKEDKKIQYEGLEEICIIDTKYQLREKTTAKFDWIRLKRLRLDLCRPALCKYLDGRKDRGTNDVIHPPLPLLQLYAQKPKNMFLFTQG